MKKLLALSLVLMMILSFSACDLLDNMLGINKRNKDTKSSVETDDSEAEVNSNSTKDSSSIADKTSDTLLFGNSWRVGDNSMITIQKDGTFKWCKNPDDSKDNYYSGKVKIFNGQDAINYLTKNYIYIGITDEKQHEYINGNGKYSINDYYCIVFEHFEHIQNGKNTQKDGEHELVAYYGFYDKSEKCFEILTFNDDKYTHFKMETD